MLVLHSDAAMMPRPRAVWSSWSYTEAPDKTTDRIDLTYWMNSLQPWLTDADVRDAERHAADPRRADLGPAR